MDIATMADLVDYDDGHPIILDLIGDSERSVPSPSGRGPG